MKGVWIWPEEEREQTRVISKIKNAPHLVTILMALAKNREGLSNPKVDRLIENNSQWNTLWDVRELMALGLVEYKVDIFGGPGRYFITELGSTIVQRISTLPKTAIEATSAA